MANVQELTLPLRGLSLSMKLKDPSLLTWENLEEGILERILALLSLRSLSPCLLVCKQWLFIITRSPSFACLHARLHSKRAWFLLYNFPAKNVMLVYDTRAKQSAFFRCLHSAGFRSKVEPLRWEGEQLLATDCGLVFSMSRDCKNFTITNFVTKKNKLLQSPKPAFGRRIHAVGMAYLWPSMSYQVLLCGQAETPGLKKGTGDTPLVTTLYNSLTGLWTVAASVLSPEDFDFSSIPLKWRHCVYTSDGRFYCFLGRTMYFFDTASLTWHKHYSLTPYGDEKPVHLPSNLTDLFCLWKHNEELLVAGNVRSRESKNTTAIWRLSSSVVVNESATFEWEQLSHVLPGECNDPAISQPHLFAWKWRYARGGYVCFMRLQADDSSMGCFEFCIYDLARKDCKVVTNVQAFFIYIQHRELENLAIQPCPYTSP
ncbi:hypothetical protein GOP47_0018189 [Adiantum capillus-veneris]|uniref:F-box domain-containing protein n=1 Tax=Adiantum capillus-veneris TaxID=13818 RepID=A0A9D4ZCI9_ADICA|nr:hypothetical protein GOP47_0018189 [Adiantum capillus-veneris]